MTEVGSGCLGAGRIRKHAEGLLAYCRENDWSGNDPYDALNSRLFNVTPFKYSRICRIAYLQFLKRLPLNIRPLLLIAEEANAKAAALFLSASLELARHGCAEAEGVVPLMIERLIALRSPGTRYWCWGYNFPWQTRTVLVPKGAPNLVSTVFVADALLQVYDAYGDERCLEMALSAAHYLVDQLYWSERDGSAGFSYPVPGLQTRVHNANFLAAAFLCRINGLSVDRQFLKPALDAARYSASRQQPDGSWHYGEGSKQQWIDNFHTGYNLCALHNICTCLPTSEFEPAVRRGFAFYRRHFFREDGAVRYFHNRTYPIDTHCVAQSIITLVTLKHLHPENVEVARRVIEWATTNMWNKKGYFYYQILPLVTNRNSYMRWSQAWMLLALATYLGATAGVSCSEMPAIHDEADEVSHRHQANQHSDLKSDSGD